MKPLCRPSTLSTRIPIFFITSAINWTLYYVLTKTQTRYATHTSVIVRCRLELGETVLSLKRDNACVVVSRFYRSSL